MTEQTALQIRAETLTKHNRVYQHRFTQFESSS